jgi:hypothetical protein
VEDALQVGREPVLERCRCVVARQVAPERTIRVLADALAELFD